MASISSEPLTEEIGNSQSGGFRRILRSRWTFVGLQILDLLTTLYAFHIGLFEANPFVTHLTLLFGRFQGVLISKLIAVAIAMGIRRLVWVINVLYIVVVGWNLIALV